MTIQQSNVCSIEFPASTGSHCRSYCRRALDSFLCVDFSRWKSLPPIEFRVPHTSSCGHTAQVCETAELANLFTTVIIMI